MTVSCNITGNVIRSTLLRKTIHNATFRRSSNRRPQTVFIDKIVEDPIIVIDSNDGVDLIGPPDPVSNLRPIIRKHQLNETTSQKRLRELQEMTQVWNQDFWTKHNTNFIKERKDFIKSQQKGEEERQLTADEMSQFYKKFLDKNWSMHINYNAEWYRKNFNLLYLSLRVVLEKILLKIS